MTRATRINEFASGDGTVRKPSRLPAHHVADCHFNSHNGAAWALCSCGVRVETEVGEDVALAYEVHRREVGLTLIHVQGRLAVADWCARQEQTA